MNKNPLFYSNMKKKILVLEKRESRKFWMDLLPAFPDIT